MWGPTRGPSRSPGPQRRLRNPAARLDPRGRTCGSARPPEGPREAPAAPPHAARPVHGRHSWTPTTTAAASRASATRTGRTGGGPAMPVSVVIPAHDEEAVLGRCLDALLGGAAPGELDVVV